MSSKTTHVLSKEEIVSRLENLHFCFEEHHWESFLQSFQEVKVQQTVSAPKFSAKLIAIPAFVVLAGIIVYFSINTLQSQNKSADKVIEAAITTDVAEGPDVEKNVVKAEAVPAKKEETTPSAPVPAPAPKPQALTAAPSQPANTTTVTTHLVSNPANNAAAKTIAPQTATVTLSGAPVQNQPTGRIYRKRKAEEKSVPPQLVPNPEEDDVVIPEN